MEYLLIALGFGFLGFTIGYYWRRTVTLTDTLKAPKSWRSDVHRKQDAVLQLQNELAKSGAVKITEMEDGSADISIKVVI